MGVAATLPELGEWTLPIIDARSSNKFVFDVKREARAG